jgi:hypothetical protein
MKSTNSAVHVKDLRFGFAPTIDPAPGIDPVGDAVALIASATPSPARMPIPGTIIINHDADRRFVLRIPDAWNGALVAAGTPGTRSEFANDAIWSEMALARGYAFASSNKGIPYNVIAEKSVTHKSLHAVYPIPFALPGIEKATAAMRFGVLSPHPVGVAAWNEDFQHLVEFARGVVRARHDSFPRRTYAVGLSNGGAQVRTALERFPEFFDGGVEYAAVRWTPQRSLLDLLPPFLAAMPGYVRSGFSDSAARATIEALGFPSDVLQPEIPAHPSLWCDYYLIYQDLSLFVFALLIDPQATASWSGYPTVPNADDPRRLPGVVQGEGLVRPELRAAYVPSERARTAIKAFAHSGAIERPLISLAGTKDVLIPPDFHAVGYAQSVADAGRARFHRLYLIENATHADSFANFGYGLQSCWPFAWAAFDQLVRTVEQNDTRGLGTTRRIAKPTQIS